MSPRRPILMVIDCDPSSLRAIERMLRPTCLVIELSDARAALARIDAGEQVDGILCDLDLREMSGSEFYRALYQRDARLASRTVFMTAMDAPPPAVGNPILAKPFVPGALRTVVDGLFTAVAAAPS